MLAETAGLILVYCPSADVNRMHEYSLDCGLLRRRAGEVGSSLPFLPGDELALVAFVNDGTRDHKWADCSSQVHRNLAIGLADTPG